jgi:hypothetical protein
MIARELGNRWSAKVPKLAKFYLVEISLESSAFGGNPKMLIIPPVFIQFTSHKEYSLTHAHYSPLIRRYQFQLQLVMVGAALVFPTGRDQKLKRKITMMGKPRMLMTPPI